MNMIPIILAAFLLCPTPSALPTEGAASDSVASVAPFDYYAPENVLKFARYLEESGDDARALTEYQRYLMSTPGERSPELYYRIGVCYAKVEKYREAAASFEKSEEFAPESSFRDSARVARARALFLEKDAWGSGAPRLIADSSSAYLRENVAALEVLSLLRGHDWGAAWREAESFSLNTTDSPLAPLATLALEGLDRPHKSASLAALLSAVVPGSGKVYTGRTADGIYSFLLVGASSWFAYEGFHDDGISSGKGWWFASASAFFYAGNVYGAAVSARQYNMVTLERLDHEIQIQINYWASF
jgi:tetratricopeptide (TPR) repeat protein